MGCDLIAALLQKFDKHLAEPIKLKVSAIFTQTSYHTMFAFKQCLSQH